MGTYFTNYEWVTPNDNMIISTSSVEEVPSNKLPLINLTCNGLLRPTQKPYRLVLRFTSEPFPTKDILSGCYGTFCVGTHVLNAIKVLKAVYDKEKKELVLILDLRQILRGVKRAMRFSFAVQLNDCGSKCPACSKGCECTFYGYNCQKIEILLPL